MLLKFNLAKLTENLLLLFLFLLPWQTRYIYSTASLNGGWWEFGSSSFFATEILLWVIIILFALERFYSNELWQKIITKTHFKTHKKYLLSCFLAFLFFGIEIVLSLSSPISHNWVFHLLEGACLAVLIVTSGNKVRSLCAFWLGGLVQALFGIYQFLTQSVFANKWLGLAYQSATQFGSGVVEVGAGGVSSGAERWLRAYGSLGGPNPLGAFLAISWILGLILIIKYCKNKWQYLVLTTGQLVILSGLILSFSRGAWLAAGTGLVIMIVVAGRDLPLRVAFIKQLLYSVFIIIFFIINLYPLFLARVNSVGRLEAQSAFVRGQQYQNFFNIFPKRPWLGVGPGTYTLALYNYDPNRPAWHYQPIHNVYALALVEVGVIGFALFVMLYWHIGTVIWKTNPIYLSVIAVLFVAAFFDHWLWSLYVGQMVWWVVLALGISSKFGLRS